MNLAKMVEQERKTLDNAHKRKEAEKVLALEKKCEVLRPIIVELNKGAFEVGLGTLFTLHNDPTHYPCPAIHVKKDSSFRGRLYDEFGEIYQKDDGSFGAGGCNHHRYNLKNKDELFLHVAKKIAEKCFKRV